MAMGRPKSTLVLDSELREQLESLANSRSLPAGLVRRAKIILLSASGKNNREIAATTGDEQDHGRPVATTVSRTGSVGTLRRVTSGPPTSD